MNFDVIPLLDRLADHAQRDLAPALSEPELARSAAVLTLVLKRSALDLDGAPGRFRRQRIDMEHMLSVYGSQTGDTQFSDLLDAPVEMERFGDYYAHDNALKAAIIVVADAIEELDVPWAAELRRDMRQAYLRWTA